MMPSKKYIANAASTTIIPINQGSINFSSLMCSHNNITYMFYFYIIFVRQSSVYSDILKV